MAVLPGYGTEAGR